MYMLEDLSSDLGKLGKKTVMMVCACDPSTGKVETGRSLELAGQTV